MIYMKILDIIKSNVNELSKRVVKDLLSREETKGYRNFTEEFLLERVNDVYGYLFSWLEKGKSKTNIETVFKEIGVKRYQKGVPLHETVLFLMLIKRHIWLFILENQYIDSVYESTKSLELNNRIVLFFDRAIINVILGYEEEIVKEIKEAGQGGLLSLIMKKRQ
jgi:hypothetical protein